MVSTRTLSFASKTETLEDVFDSLGGFGRFQGFIMCCLLFFEIPAAVTIFSPILAGASPNTWMCDGSPVETENICGCQRNLTSLESTIVSEWGLVCDLAWVSDFTTTVQMFGLLVGNFVTGICADWYGRRKCFFGSVLTLLLGSVLSGLSPNVYVYIGARFLCGMGYSSYVSLSATYTMEFMTPKYRSVCVSFGPIGEGIVLLGVIGYFCQSSWRLLILVGAMPYFLIFLIFPIIPESPRWLLAHGRVAEATSVFEMVAKFNSHKVIDLEMTVSRIAIQGESTHGNTRQTTYVQFLKNRALRMTALYLGLVWIAWVIMYFGLSYNLKNISGDRYLNVIYLGICDVVAYPLSYFVGLRVSRRHLVAAFMTSSAFLLSVLALFHLALPEVASNQSLTLGLALGGKFFAAGGRSVLRLFTGESFPTSVRNMGFGVVGIMAATFAPLAPQIALLGSSDRSLPFFVFGICSLVGAVVSFMVKETKDLPLTERVSDK